MRHEGQDHAARKDQHAPRACRDERQDVAHILDQRRHARRDATGDQRVARRGRRSVPGRADAGLGAVALCRPSAALSASTRVTASSTRSWLSRPSARAALTSRIRSALGSSENRITSQPAMMHFGQRLVARTPVAQPGHRRRIRNDQAIEAQLAAQQVLVEHPAERGGPDRPRRRHRDRSARTKAGSAIWADITAHARPPRWPRDRAGRSVASHSAMRQRIDRGHQMLVAVVIAFARPVLDRGGDAIGLERGDLRQRVALDACRCRCHRSGCRRWRCARRR